MPANHAMNAHQLVSEIWRKLAACHAGAASGMEAVLDELIAAYREPGRRYHTLEHIAALLRQLDQHRQAMHDADALALAILFHDAVYNPMRADNERQSAELARARLTALAFAPALVAKVARYIEATQHGHTLETGDADLDLLLDLDLSTLAAVPKVYLSYAKAIRGEYAHVPDELYRRGRRQILEGFLARERIYRTEQLHRLWEQRARVNISAEIADLT